MAVVPMKLLTIAGPLDQLDAVIASCVINQEFHPENTLTLMGEVSKLRPFQIANPYTALLRRAEDLADRLGIALEYVPFEGVPQEEEAQTYFDHLSAMMDEMEGRRETARTNAEHDRNVAEQLEHLHGVSGELDALWTMTFARFRYGYLPRETYDSFQTVLDDEEDIFFIPTSIEQKRVYGVYFTTNAAHRRVDTLFNSLHFVRIHIDAPIHGTVDDALGELKENTSREEAMVLSIGQELENLSKGEHDHLLSIYSGLRYQNDAYDLRRFAAHSNETFYLMGWVPRDMVDAHVEKLGTFEHISCVVDAAEDVPDVIPPTKLKNSFFGNIFAPFLAMYGVPSYHELDPSLFMSITYCLFYGIMFGDIGQGLCMALVGLYLTKKKGMWLGHIMTCCGLSGAIFGCVYGSVFGYEEILPGFKILEEGNVLTLLVASLSLGIIMLAFVMVLNIINGVKQKNYEKIFFGPNGMAGMVFYLGIIIAAISTLLLGVNLFVPAYIIPVLVLPLIIILLKEPLSELLSGDPHWKDINVGEVFGIGLFELFETLLSYLTNTLSFLRVGAYAITHVGLMMVVHMLAGNDNIIIIVLGNIFVMGFEGLLVGIQVLRLEFYELFGRFYADGGVPFEPKIIDYSSHTNS